MTNLFVLLFVLFWVGLGIKILGWILLDRFINGAPSKPSAKVFPPTYLEWVRGRYMNGHYNLIEFLEEVDKLFAAGIHDNVRPVQVAPPVSRCPTTRRLSDGNGEYVEVVVFGSPTFGRTQMAPTPDEIRDWTTWDSADPF